MTDIKTDLTQAVLDEKLDRNTRELLLRALLAVTVTPPAVESKVNAQVEAQYELAKRLSNDKKNPYGQLGAGIMGQALGARAGLGQDFANASDLQGYFGNQCISYHSGPGTVNRIPGLGRS